MPSNPARDFGPRLLAWMAGWGQVAFPGNGPLPGSANTLGYSNYFWVPIVGPIVGGVIAALVYQVTLHPILSAKFEAIPGAESKGETVRDERSAPANPSMT